MAEKDIQNTETADADQNIKRKVLIAIDASENAEFAFDFYIKTLHQAENKVIFVHCSEPPYIETMAAAGIGGYVSNFQYEQIVGEKRSEVKRLTEKYIERAKALKLNYKIHLYEFCGKPGQAIVETSDTENVDMIIMGTRGLGLIRRTILGSVSDYVVHHTNRAVIVCPMPEKSDKKD